MNLPDPQNYQDGVLYFHDTHKVILHECAELENLLVDAESEGVFQSFATRPEWNDTLQFFQKSAPRHEREEEQFLFPAIAEHISRVGFQQPDSTIRFLIEGHEVLERSMDVLVHDWEAYLSIPHTASALGTAHDTHTTEDARFIATGRELIRLYREHIATEERRVYSQADKLLSGVEKLALSDRLRAFYGDDAITAILNYEEPRFSNPNYNIVYDPTEVVGDEALEPDEEEDEDNEDDFAGSDDENL
jgi:hemerythrin-like domain-containing protein